MGNKTVIFGDSYSTFEGFIPDGYLTYYSKTLHPEVGVDAVGQTWWNQVITESGLELVLNNSWSGSTIGYTGYDDADCSTSSSFIYRLKQLIENGFFKENKIDKVFVFGGTNDSWSNAPLGDVQLGNWQEQDLYFVLPAVCFFLNLLKQTLPEADIYCLINTDIKTEITDCMKTACGEYGITPVGFDSIDKVRGHPTVKGMNDIKDAVLKALK